MGKVTIWVKYFVFIHFRVNCFSTLVNIKTKPRNKRDCEPEPRCALSATKPQIKNSYIL